MQKTFYAVALCACFLLCCEHIPMQSFGNPDGTLIAGLKQALSIGTERAVQEIAQPDGYFGNRAIKILLPESMQKAAEVLGKLGMRRQVDAFILSMNRAAEKAAPQAASIFSAAIRNMSIEDAQQVYRGGETAATEFFKDKTSEQIFSVFKPIISSSMREVGTTALFNNLMTKYNGIPFVPKTTLDIEQYVTAKATDGLFFMVAQEEKKIRTDPAARTTELLKSVFGR
jgi:hypothetical protein